MDIGKLLGDVLGSQNGQQISQKLKQAVGSSGKSGSPLGGLTGGLIGGGLMGAVLGSKKGRKLGGKVLTYGGTALVAGLAYKAWRDYSNNKKPQSHVHDADVIDVPADSGFAPEAERDSGQNDFRLALIRAMIAAAKSDGHIDQAEHARIKQQIEDFELGPEEKGFLFDAFSADADPLAIARLASTSQQGAEIYLASALAIDPDEPSERQYLERLAGCLGIVADLRAHLDMQVQSARRELAPPG